MPDTEILEDYPDRCRRSLAPSPEPSNPLGIPELPSQTENLQVLDGRALSRS
jgi:hypothetical protein